MLLLNSCFEYGIAGSAWARRPPPGLVRPAESEVTGQSAQPRSS
jgi:hypothetical protein